MNNVEMVNMNYHNKVIISFNTISKRYRLSLCLIFGCDTGLLTIKYKQVRKLEKRTH